MSKSIGVAIPCYEGHIELLKTLLDSINIQTINPNIVVVSCSSTKELILNKTYHFNLKIVTTEHLKNAAENRNIACKYINTDIITFCDADDIMHPQRIEIILNTFNNNNIDILYHNGIYKEPYISSPFEKIDSADVIYNELRQSQCGCITHNNYNNYSIFHGHVTVKANIYNKVKFNEHYTYNLKDDCAFGYDVFNLPDIKSAYVINPLIKYTFSRSMEKFDENINKI